MILLLVDILEREEHYQFLGSFFGCDSGRMLSGTAMDVLYKQGQNLQTTNLMDYYNL
jgi:hypothetical protein